MELDVTAEEWDKLIETANAIVKNSRRDLILWEQVLIHARECKAKIRQVADGDIELPDGLMPG